MQVIYNLQLFIFQQYSPNHSKPAVTYLQFLFFFEYIVIIHNHTIPNSHLPCWWMIYLSMWKTSLGYMQQVLQGSHSGHTLGEKNSTFTFILLAYIQIRSSIKICEQELGIWILANSHFWHYYGGLTLFVGMKLTWLKKLSSPA